ncbi:MAG: hypothetical protein HY831_04610 [Candidatus Aenigmarchaeota archaeon]|nr:hypothetical protein [Candidatus Aenigmarchaeota archaeon]
MSDVLEEYKKLQVKFNLPEMQELKTMFQFNENVSDIEEVRNEMTNKIFEFMERVVEPLVWCNNQCHMIEKSMLTEEESKDLFSTYKKTQALKWRNNLLLIKPDNKESAKLIKDLWDFWTSFEPNMSKICMKFSDGWSDLKFKNEQVNYHG